MDLRELPAVDRLAGELADVFDLPAPLLVAVARDAVDEARRGLLAGRPADAVEEARRRATTLASARLRRLVNATGVLLHTNLGRAPLDADAAERGAAAWRDYTNLEFDLATGHRGRRARWIRSLVATLTGADDALVVNNNAGALVLALAALAGPGGRVAVSRGELIEIGGSFRLPELMTAAGVRLVEVGTTNRTHLADYDVDADVILKVHPSNYRVEGFTASADWRELARLASRRGVPFVADLGSGLLDERTPWLPDGPPPWLGGEPGARQVLASGADVVLFSGDKLLGGPQAGIVAGKGAAVSLMAAHPLARALRVDAATSAALAATLERYADGTAAGLPFWRMATLPRVELQERCVGVLEASGASGAVVEGASVVGAGSAPGSEIPTPVLRLDGDAEAWWRRLLDHEPPVIVRRRDAAVVIDLRTVDPEDDAVVTEALR